MSMLVCKNACLNSSSCVSFLSSFLSFLLQFLHMYPLLTTCLHHVSSFYASTSISIFMFHAIRSSYLCPSLCSSTLSGHPSSSVFQPSGSRCMRHEPQIAKLETTLRTSIGQRFMKVCCLVTVHGRLCASCSFFTKHGRMCVSVLLF